ncbi:MAG: riboflavin synthase [Nitrospinota bacterium]|nr:riboflavin synthase [Nitrospinota bacterium]
MFTGIIEALGTVGTLDLYDQKGRLTIATSRDFGPFDLGESIAVNGVCLTVAGSSDSTFTVDLSTETLNRTSFRGIRPGRKVNLERSLIPGKKISGHFIMGHVDEVGTITQIDRKSGETLFRFEHSRDLQPFVIEKGSVAVDGISLTAFSCRDCQFSVSIIPFTLEHTHLHDRKIGEKVNLECDMIGKYVYKACESLLGARGTGKGITLDMLKKHGFE